MGENHQKKVNTLRGGPAAMVGGKQPGYKFPRRHLPLSTAPGGSIPLFGGPGVRERIGIPPAFGAAPRGNWKLRRQPARCPFAPIACGSIPLHDGQA